jgi:hypothetical protein
MIAGHFGFAAGVKGRQPQVPLWALMLATVWLDILFAPFLAAGVESFDTVPGTSGGYGNAIIHADYTHSLSARWSWPLCSGWSPLGPGVGRPAWCWGRWCSPTGCWT